MEAEGGADVSILVRPECYTSTFRSVCVMSVDVWPALPTVVMLSVNLRIQELSLQHYIHIRRGADVNEYVVQVYSRM